MKGFGGISHLQHAGMDGLIVYFSGPDLTQANQAVQRYAAALTQANPDWLRELLPAYDSLTLIFAPSLIDSHGVYQCLRQLHIVGHTESASAQVHILPVWYGAPQCDDFKHIQQHTGLSRDQIIHAHCGNEYRVYAVGFAPGFAYMGEIPQQLACPRLSSPRQQVPKGAVAIADRQTAVYPQSSPGGWNLLGLCPLPMFDASQQPASMLSVGDTVRFEAISEQQYQEMVNNGH